MLHTAKHPIFIALTLRFTIYSTRIITQSPILAPPERHCRSVFTARGIENAPVLFPALIYFFYFSFKSASFQFGDFIIFIVLFLFFVISYGTSVGSNSCFFQVGYFLCLLFFIPISTALLLRLAHRIDFKVLTPLLGFGYERLTFQGGVTTLPRIVLSLNPALSLGQSYVLLLYRYICRI